MGKPKKRRFVKGKKSKCKDFLYLQCKLAITELAYLVLFPYPTNMYKRVKVDELILQGTPWNPLKDPWGSPDPTLRTNTLTHSDQDSYFVKQHVVPLRFPQ